MSEVKDVVGQTISVGDIVVYSYKTGSSTRTQVAVVKRVNSKTEIRRDWDYQNQRYKEGGTEYTVNSLKVRSLDRWARPLALSNKDAVITYVERVTKVRFDDISPALQDIFRQAVIEAISGASAVA